MSLARTLFLVSTCTAVLVGCNEQDSQSAVSASSDGAQAVAAIATPVTLDVYKSETCGCCGDWMEHMESDKFQLTAHHPEDLAAEKQRLGVAAQYQSCHTTVSPEGYVFEGHIPAKLVERFLEEKPAGAIGLAVPGMPAGSPGMEMGDRFTPYDVLLLKEDGSSEVYASIVSAGEQY